MCWESRNASYISGSIVLGMYLHLVSSAVFARLDIMHFLFLLHLLLLGASNSVANPTPAPAPSPTKFLEPRATTCAADNCYRAAKSLNENYEGSYYNSINPLCSSYTSPPTIVTSLTSSPLILPSSCSAPRISSLCDCLAPAPPCATRAAAQRVENPSFELGYYSGTTQALPYWAITDTANNWDNYNNNEQDYQGNYGMYVSAEVCELGSYIRFFKVLTVPST